ncbi:putative anthocyanidin reductase [Triticum aestivum]|uniref:putative anthocyanidin reductase n=1 Tax=Triticum aestivum TaxID=4565 RepID=UPI001D00DC5D|nr:putative anthocyanidin reductase [Triticum aestivum]
MVARSENNRGYGRQSPMQELSRYKDTTEAIEDATRAILEQCERSKTVRRVISTGSVITASPLREDGEGYKEFVNESCWTPLSLPIDHNNEFMHEYLSSKCIAEKELVKYNDRPSKGRAFDIIVLLLGLVAGDTLGLLPYINKSQHFMLSPFTGIEPYHNALRFTQAVLGAVPVVHVDDVSEAHVFCMERQHDVAAGRYLCATAHTNMQDMVEHYAGKHPELKLARKEYFSSTKYSKLSVWWCINCEL